MPAQPLQALQAALRPATTPAPKPRLLVAGATGVLGNEVLRRLVGLQRFEHARVLAREPMRDGLRAVSALVVAGDDPGQWPPEAADTAVVLFDPPRLFYDRERALWTPAPGQLLALARWLRGCGVTTLAVVLPHAPGRLPEALKRGLADLDEQAVAALGFTRLLLIRSARAPVIAPEPSLPRRVARWMLGVLKYMVPSSEQPVRAVKVAQLVALALELAPPGIHVAAPELVWQAAQADMRATLARWLHA